MCSRTNRRVVLAFTGAFLGLPLAGCSDSNAPVVLASAPVSNSGGGAMLASSVTFTLRITDLATDTITNRAELFGQLPLQNGDKGRVLVATAATAPGFNRFVSFLTDGVNESVGYTVVLGGGGGYGESTSESSFFTGRPGGGVDFAGYTITSIEFHVDSILLSTPGSDLNMNGIWTDYYFSGNVVVFGHPD